MKICILIIAGKINETKQKMVIFSANARVVILHTKGNKKIIKIFNNTLVKKAEVGGKLTIKISINVFVPCPTFLPIYKCSTLSGTYSVTMRTQKQRLGAKHGCQRTGDVVLETQLRIHLLPCSPVRVFAGSRWKALGFLYLSFSGCPTEFLGSFGFVYTVTDALG